MACSSTSHPAVIAAMRARRVQLARTDLPSFVEYVGRDERTGAPVVLAPYQEQLLHFVESNRLAVIHSHIESGKSFLVGAMRTLWLLGRDPGARVVVCSSAHGQAERVVRTVKAYIEQSAELHEVFPKLKPGSPWRDDLLVVARANIGKDASLIATGVRGQVLGARADHVVLDDVDDRESTSTEHMRTETLGWLRSTLLSRLTHGGTAVALGTPWHPGDALHTFGAENWPTLRLGVLDENGRPRWPARWPLDRIEQTRRTMSIFEAARALDVEVRDEGAATFRREWVDHALDRGRGRPTLAALHSQAQAFVVVGVDLAVSKNERADKSAFAVVACHPNGDRELLRIESARLSASEILQRIVTLHTWFRPAVIVVENNASQDFIRQLVQASTSIPVVGYRTGQGKMSLPFQCELLASEMARGKWSFRGADTPEVQALVRDMLFYAPTRHTPDALAALCFARWGAESRSYRVESVAFDFNRR